MKSIVEPKTWYIAKYEIFLISGRLSSIKNISFMLENLCYPEINYIDKHEV